MIEFESKSTVEVLKEVLGENFDEEFFTNYNMTACRNHCHNVARVYMFKFDRIVRENKIKKAFDQYFQERIKQPKTILNYCPKCGAKI